MPIIGTWPPITHWAGHHHDRADADDHDAPFIIDIGTAPPASPGMSATRPPGFLPPRSARPLDPRLVLPVARC
jgi:hypothetical protein